MSEPGSLGSGPAGHAGSWIEVDRRYWQDPRDGLVWQVIAWADRDVSLSAIHDGSANQASAMLGFDALHLQHVVRWSDPKPLRRLSNEEFQKLLDEAMKDAPH